MIRVRAVTKDYGKTRAVDGLSFDVLPGRVTGFLGPNGAGKSTTMRMIIGLDRPTSGSITVGGRPYTDIRRPMHEVGAVLETRAVHGGRSAYNHLLCLAQSNGIGRRRVSEVLELVGLDGVARRRAGAFSLGMTQRLGLAAAMLGDPAVLLCDEPVNGLDPEGILWIRTMLRGLAAEGRTVFVSSHLMSEMALTADHVIVVGKGKLIADESTKDFIGRSSVNSVLVSTPAYRRFSDLMQGAGATVGHESEESLQVSGLDIRRNRRAGREASHHAARTHAANRVPRGGVHGTHRGQPRLPCRACIMTTAVHHPGGATSPRTTVGISNVLRSEWTKLRSVRSTYFTALLAVLATLSIGIIVCAQWVHDIHRHPLDKTIDPVLTSLNGIYLAQIAVGALGVLVISSEYGTGMIRATFAAVPQRRSVLLAKLAVFTSATLVVGEALSFTAFGIGQAILRNAGAGVSLNSAGTLRAVFGGGLYLAVIGVLGFGLGALIRRTAGALSALFGMLFASSAIVDLLPTGWRDATIKYMPLNAGSQIFTTQPTHDSLAPWTGLAVLCLYGIGALAAALVIVTRRDA